MQVQKRNTGKFAKAGQDFNDGDILIILNEGTIEQGDFGDQNVFSVRLPNGESMSLGFNQTSMNKIIDVYGNETLDWKGKNVKAWVVRSMISGKMRNVVYLTAPDQTLED